MTSGSCLCGAVTFEVPMAPTEVTTCNCGACRKLGALWAYYDREEVRISGKTLGFERHDIPNQDAPMLAFHHCPTCGCVTHWADLTPTEPRMAVNARLMAPEIVETAGLRRFDGAGTLTASDDKA